VRIDRAALEHELARLFDSPVRSPVPLGPTIDLTGGPGASWLRLVRQMAADATQSQGLIHHPVVGARLRHGFTHMGRVAAEYPARYGVPPRETLRT
jgi:hypothetical protein